MKLKNILIHPNMKTKVLLLSLLGILFILPASRAQVNARRNQIESQKIAFFTRRLDLSANEATQFWPVYNAYEKSLGEVRGERAQHLRMSAMNRSKMNEQELSEAADQLLELRLKETAIEKEYHQKLREVLGASKLILLYQTEQQYKTFLLNQIRERNLNRRNNRPQAVR